MSMSELLHLMKSLGEGLSDKTLQQVQNVAEPDTDGQVCQGMVERIERREQKNSDLTHETHFLRLQVNYRHFVEKMVKDL